MDPLFVCSEDASPVSLSVERKTDAPMSYVLHVTLDDTNPVYEGFRCLEKVCLWANGSLF